MAEEMREMNLIRGFRRFAVVFMLVGFAALMSGCMDKFYVLDPKGEVGRHQLDLIVISTLLCLVIIVPVLVLTFVIAWKYRNRKDSKALYQPEWEHSTKLEIIWWSIPILIIVILGAITVSYTYKLEPSKPLQHEAKPITIQVTSLDWKWFFIYPEQGIATVNYIQFPEDVPVKFELTSDAPMNSFWIPQLGGQIYTMSGMAMNLHLIADEPGTYYGTAANFSGKDFAKMNFDAKATSQADFDKWVRNVKQMAPALTQEGYDKLAEPGTMKTQDYSSVPEGLFEKIVTKYTGPDGHHVHKAEENLPVNPDTGGDAPQSSTHHHH
jgi:cytochrome o ubiquinol oxidase subunit 2